VSHRHARSARFLHAPTRHQRRQWDRRDRRNAGVLSARGEFGDIIGASDGENSDDPFEEDAAMSEPRVSASSVTCLLIALLFTIAVPARGQERPAHPFAPTWANLAGGRVFTEKACGLCHAIRGAGPTAGPELARIERKTFFDLGAAMSNHLRGVAIPKPTLSPDEVTSLIAFLFTLQYHDQPGDAKAGEQAFTAKGCVQCHELGGKGGRRGPSLDFLKHANSPVLVAAALWNHGPEMAEAVEVRGVPRPTFTGKELADIVAFIAAAAKEGGGEAAFVAPGVPERGDKLFKAKQCAECHAVGGKGGRIGPELGKQQHVSLTEFAARMWNHGPKMWARMQERGIQVPRLKAGEMADIVAYLYVAHYFDQEVSAARGQQVLQDRGCLGCHAARGQGGRTAADLGTYRAARSAPALVASLWNHPRYLEKERREVPWPILTGQELADMAAFLGSLPRTGGIAPRTN
jgi:mono/diheme cytochrome c family protein